MRIAFLGLGRMGEPMAHRLLQAGFSLSVYNRNPSRAAALIAKGARLAAAPAEAVRDAELVMTMLADDAALEAVLWGRGDDRAAAVPAFASGAIHVSHSTISLALARRLEAAHAAAGHGFVSAPVFGRPDSISAGKLRVLAAGAPAPLDTVLPTLTALGQEVLYIGVQPHLANAVKLAGNFTLAAMIEALGEAIALAESAGVAPAMLMPVLDQIFQSPVYRNYGGLLAARRFEPAGFALRLGLKDATLVRQAAAERQLELPLVELVHAQLSAALDRGWGERDWSAFSQIAAAADH